MSCALRTIKDDNRRQGRDVDGEPLTVQTEFLKPPRLSWATMSSSSMMLSPTSYTAKSTRNALTSRLNPCRSPLSSDSRSLSGRLPMIELAYAHRNALLSVAAPFEARL